MMILKDLEIGSRFKLKSGNTVWIKKTEQGMNNDYSYCESEDFKNTRNPSRKKKTEKLFNQKTKIVRL